MTEPTMDEKTTRVLRRIAGDLEDIARVKPHDDSGTYVTVRRDYLEGVATTLRRLTCP